MSQVIAQDLPPSAHLPHAFNWVMREVVMDTANRASFYKAVSESSNMGNQQAIKLLKPAWPATAAWPSGHSFIQNETIAAWSEDGEWKQGDALPEVSTKELLSLLRQRILRVQQRLFRTVQITELLADTETHARYTHIEMNRFLDPVDDYCGHGVRVMLCIPEGIARMQQPACPHPACSCTFDPKKSTE